MRRMASTRVGCGVGGIINKYQAGGREGRRRGKRVGGEEMARSFRLLQLEEEEEEEEEDRLSSEEEPPRCLAC